MDLIFRYPGEGPGSMFAFDATRKNQVVVGTAGGLDAAYVRLDWRTEPERTRSTRWWWEPDPF
jgi:hypothetical protein